MLKEVSLFLHFGRTIVIDNLTLENLTNTTIAEVCTRIYAHCCKSKTVFYLWMEMARHKVLIS
jgi:hypothetical protein